MQRGCCCCCHLWTSWNGGHGRRPPCCYCCCSWRWSFWFESIGTVFSAGVVHSTTVVWRQTFQPPRTPKKQQKRHEQLPVGNRSSFLCVCVSSGKDTDGSESRNSYRYQAKLVSLCNVSCCLSPKGGSDDGERRRNEAMSVHGCDSDCKTSAAREKNVAVTDRRRRAYFQKLLVVPVPVRWGAGSGRLSPSRPSWQGKLGASRKLNAAFRWQQPADAVECRSAEDTDDLIAYFSSTSYVLE